MDVARGHALQKVFEEIFVRCLGGGFGGTIHELGRVRLPGILERWGVFVKSPCIVDVNSL